MKLFSLIFLLLTVPVFAQGVYTPQQFGAVGDGVADDTGALQAMIDAMPNYAQAEFIAGQKFKITSTLLIQDREGLKFVGKSGVGSAAGPNHNNPIFYWYGPSGGTMTFVNRSRGLVFEGLTWVTYDYFLPAAANVAIDFDMNPIVPGHITTDCIIDRCSFWQSAAPNPNLALVRIAFTSHQNCEFITIRDSNFNSQRQSGVGVRIGPSYNAKGIRLERNAFNRFERGVWCVVGSFSAIGGNASANALDFWIDNAVEPVTIAETVSESWRFLYTGSSDAPVTLRANKWEGPTPAGLSPIEYGPSGSILIVEGNYFGTPPTDATFFKPSSNAALISFGNIYNFAQSQAGLGGFNYGTLSFRDNWRGGGTTDLSLFRTKIRGTDESGTLKHIIGRGDSFQTAGHFDVVSIDEDKLGAQFGADVRFFGTMRSIVPTLTSNTTLTSQSPTYMVADTSAGNFAITLPPASSYLPQFKVTSPIYTIKKIGVGVLTLNVAAGQKIENVLAYPMERDGYAITLISDGKQWRIVSGF